MDRQSILKLKKKASLGDQAICLKDNLIYIGRICFISMRGINIRMDRKSQFFRWHNILDIEKNENQPPGICDRFMESCNNE